MTIVLKLGPGEGVSKNWCIAFVVCCLALLFDAFEAVDTCVIFECAFLRREVAGCNKAFVLCSKLLT